jgi:hypothetical protein
MKRVGFIDLKRTPGNEEDPSFLRGLKNILLWRNAQLQAKPSRGFHPRRCGSPDAITPEQVLRHHRLAQGRYGGTGTVPSFIRTSILNFISREKEFYKAKIFLLKNNFRAHEQGSKKLEHPTVISPKPFRLPLCDSS